MNKQTKWEEITMMGMAVYNLCQSCGDCENCNPIQKFLIMIENIQDKVKRELGWRLAIVLALTELHVNKSSIDYYKNLIELVGQINLYTFAGFCLGQFISQEDSHAHLDKDALCLIIQEWKEIFEEDRIIEVISPYNEMFEDLKMAA